MDKFLSDSAEEYIHLGQTLESQGDLVKAEQAFLKALRILDGCLCSSDDPLVTSKAKKLCLYLADLDMQQGNMHGADVYYVKAMQYSDKQK